jgi:hypothetical protein
MHHHWENDLPYLGSMLYHPSDVDGRLEQSHTRKDTMYLDVVKPKDVPRGRPQVTKDHAQALVTEDIEGAAPRKRTWALHGGGACADSSDIRVQKSKPLYAAVNRQVDLSLTTTDIEGAKPKNVVFKTDRMVNPLTPRYALPSAKPAPYDVPKQLVHEGEVRDPLSFKGEPSRRIPKARTNVEEPIAMSARTLIRPREEREKLWTIEQAGARILSSKFTPRGPAAEAVVPVAVERSPLDPVYVELGEDKTTHPMCQSSGGSSAVELSPTSKGATSKKLFGPIEGATPRVLHQNNQEPQLSLIRRDIGGALPQRRKGAYHFNLYDTADTTPYAKSLGLDCSDIPGAQPGTRMPGTGP